MASSVAFGLASSLVSSAHPPILSLFVDMVKFPSGISSSPDSKATVQLKSPWVFSPEVVTASFKVHVAVLSTVSSPFVYITFICVEYEAGKFELTKAAKKK